MYNELVDFIRKEFRSEEFIPLHAPVFVGNERKYVAETIDSTFVSSVGKFVDRFEEIIREYTGARYAIATVNGTAALHMSLILAGVKKDDLVLTQALSFIATCNAISYLYAEPVFIDIDRQTLGLSPQALEEFLSGNTIQKNGACYHKESGRKISACVPMHTFGHPAHIDLIADICEKYNVVLVEDAAESIGSFYKGVHTGNYGKLGAFSFNGNKTVTCGGGGVIITNDEHLGKLGKHLTTQAKVPHKWDFVHDHIGYNYRMPNLNAAMACAQMEQIESFIENKRALSAAYADFFETSSLTFVKEPAGSRSNYWLNAILVKDYEERNRLLTHLNDANIMSRPCWALMHKLEMFKNCYRDAQTNAEWIEERLVNIPSSVRLTDEG
jgi:aminotransferase in exopolysaccharide biosynthesis